MAKLKIRKRGKRMLNNYYVHYSARFAVDFNVKAESEEEAREKAYEKGSLIATNDLEFIDDRVDLWIDYEDDEESEEE